MEIREIYSKIKEIEIKPISALGVNDKIIFNIFKTIPIPGGNRLFGEVTIYKIRKY